MKLIADSGSTKTEWILQGHSHSMSTTGYNPYFMDAASIAASIATELLPLLRAEEVTAIYFYGSGCSHPSKVLTVTEALQTCFPQAGQIEVHHDLLGAARALLGSQPGFAAILGTGTNTCLFNGQNIIQNIDSLGYQLGDEGSGSYLGRKLLRDFLRQQMPPELQSDFERQFGIDMQEVLQRLYHGERPNRYLAGFAAFAGTHASHEYIRQRVREGFTDFFKNIVCHYPHYKKYSLNCVGSVGYAFADLLADVASDFDMPFGQVLKSPAHGLAGFHFV